MGTRADFYIIRNDKKFDWVGSLYKDGHPWNIPTDILIQINPIAFEELVVEFLQTKESVIASENGEWPWPWIDSRMTDYSYLFGFDNNERAIAYSPIVNGLFDPLAVIQGKEINISSCEIPSFPVMSIVAGLSEELISRYGSQSTETI